MAANPLAPNNFPPESAAEWGQDAYGLWATWYYDDVPFTMRWIPAGRFLMGSPKSELERYDDEVQHEVTISRGFWLAETTVTQALWRQVIGENPSEYEGDQHPVDSISWDNCSDFIEKLNQHYQLSVQFRFPTEAEWEYACRAGTQTPFHFGSNINTDYINFNGNYPYDKGKKCEYRGCTVDVSALPCNKWGLYQMHGNVWEWCFDFFDDHLKGLQVDPPGLKVGTLRVLRGGSWFNVGRDIRSARRIAFGPEVRDVNTSLRLALGHELR